MIKLYITLFTTFVKIGLFSFGGGYAMIPLIQQEVVDKNAWISLEQFTDIIAISQITPGPIAINVATFIGYTTTGNILGATLATLGVVLPSLIIMIVLVKFLSKTQDNIYVIRAFKGLRLIVIGLILGAAFSLMKPEILIDYKSYILLFLSMIALIKFKIGPIPIVITSFILGIFLY
jgi:chromate transporter